jgi:hypothetical protein
MPCAEISHVARIHIQVRGDWILTPKDAFTARLKRAMYLDEGWTPFRGPTLDVLHDFVQFIESFAIPFGQSDLL